jgi:hypothetical protein
MLLAFFEVIYLWLGIISLRVSKVENKIKIVLSFTASAMRLIFIVTFYLFEIEIYSIINTIHKDLIIIYIANWFLETIWNLFFTLF